MLNIALLAPIPTPRVSTTRMANAGPRSELRSAYRMSWSMSRASFGCDEPRGRAGMLPRCEMRTPPSNPVRSRVTGPCAGREDDRGRARYGDDSRLISFTTPPHRRAVQEDVASGPPPERTCEQSSRRLRQRESYRVRFALDGRRVSKGLHKPSHTGGLSRGVGARPLTGK